MILTKHHGLANDFLVALDERNGAALAVDAASAVRLCDRRTGVGADGLIHGAAPGAGTDADVVMVLYNADGSRAELSGNGLRCLAQALLRARDEPAGRVVVATDAGLRVVTIHDDPGSGLATASVEMGVAAPGPEIPPAVADRLVAFGGGRATTVDMGNPHLVVEVEDPTTVDLAVHGAWIEERFAGGVNVELVALAGDDALRMRVWERGAGLTEACGTGACAAVVAAHGWGLVGPEAAVHMPGGAADVSLGADEVAAHPPQVVLTGPAQLVATIEVPDG